MEGHLLLDPSSSNLLKCRMLFLCGANTVSPPLRTETPPKTTAIDADMGLHPLAMLLVALHQRQRWPLKAVQRPHALALAAVLIGAHEGHITPLPLLVRQAVIGPLSRCWRRFTCLRKALPKRYQCLVGCQQIAAASDLSRQPEQK